jgi:beta-1,4-N-acetylglucosaminyltransferase
MGGLAKRLGPPGKVCLSVHWRGRCFRPSVTVMKRKPGRRARKDVDLWLVCSSGGHLLQLVSLQEAWTGSSRVWISNDRSDARSLLAGEDAHFLPGPFSRDARAFVRNLVFALKLVRRQRPRVVVTTGADIAVPVALVARLAGAKIVYVESFTRITTPSLSCRLIAPLAERVYVQWPELQQAMPKARFAGAVVEAA